MEKFDLQSYVTQIEKWGSSLLKKEIDNLDLYKLSF